MATLDLMLFISQQVNDRFDVISWSLYLTCSLSERFSVVRLLSDKRYRFAPNQENIVLLAE